MSDDRNAPDSPQGALPAPGKFPGRLPAVKRLEAHLPANNHALSPILSLDSIPHHGFPAVSLQKQFLSTTKPSPPTRFQQPPVPPTSILGKCLGGNAALMPGLVRLTPDRRGPEPRDRQIVKFAPSGGGTSFDEMNARDGRNVRALNGRRSAALRRP